VIAKLNESTARSAGDATVRMVLFPKCGHTRILPGAATETYIDHDSPSRPQVTRCHAGPVEVAVYQTPMAKA
jgi:hypothetical protein